MKLTSRLSIAQYQKGLFENIKLGIKPTDADLKA